MLLPGARTLSPLPDPSPRPAKPPWGPKSTWIQEVRFEVPRPPPEVDMTRIGVEVDMTRIDFSCIFTAKKQF